jgi:hypothetical protein
VSAFILGLLKKFSGSAYVIQEDDEDNLCLRHGYLENEIKDGRM